MAENETKITIDGVEYNLADLSEEARGQAMNVHLTDREIERLNQRLAIARTARATYARALTAAMPKVTQ